MYLDNRALIISYEKAGTSLSVLGEAIIGFEPLEREIKKLSDLKTFGNYLFFYTPNPEAANDSIKYFREASPSCLASYNGIGLDIYDPPTEGRTNYIVLCFNGRDYATYKQREVLPNRILRSLMLDKTEMEKVGKYLKKSYQIVISNKAIIYRNDRSKTKMYLIENDPLEVLEEKGKWLKIKFHLEKEGISTGKFIEGWIKKSDVE